MSGRVEMSHVGFESPCFLCGDVCVAAVLRFCMVSLVGRGIWCCYLVMWYVERFLSLVDEIITTALNICFLLNEYFVQLFVLFLCTIDMIFPYALHMSTFFG
jgi:hypothetical protein